MFFFAYQNFQKHWTWFCRPDLGYDVYHGCFCARVIPRRLQLRFVPLPPDMTGCRFKHAKDQTHAGWSFDDMDLDSRSCRERWLMCVPAFVMLFVSVIRWGLLSLPVQYRQVAWPQKRLEVQSTSNKFLLKTTSSRRRTRQTKLVLNYRIFIKTTYNLQVFKLFKSSAAIFSCFFP